MQLIGLKMEVVEDEFEGDREGLSIAAGINTQLSDQVVLACSSAGSENLASLESLHAMQAWQ